MDRLRDRVILITGSTGIAAATARRAVAEGASVFVVSARPSTPVAWPTTWRPAAAGPGGPPPT